MSNTKFLTENSRITNAYEIMMVNEGLSSTSKISKVISKYGNFNNVKSNDGDYEQKKINSIFPQDPSIKRCPGPDRNSIKTIIPLSNEIKNDIPKFKDTSKNQQRLPLPDKKDNTSLNVDANKSIQNVNTNNTAEIEYPENGDIEFTGEEEDWILGKSDVRPSTLDKNMTREEFQKKFYGESYDAKVEDAIEKVTEICAKYNTRVSSVVDNDSDDYVKLIIKITDNGKTPGTGFNMNYIMGVGYSIESEMKKKGINGFVGSRYIGCSTNIEINKNDPFLGIEESCCSNRKNKKRITESENDNEDYTYFVLISDGSSWKIESGWEFKEDAIEHAKENKDTVLFKKYVMKVVSRKFLSKYSIDASNDSCWWIYNSDVAESSNFLNRSTGFYDKPRTNEEIKIEFDSIEKEPVIGYDNEGSPIYVQYDVKDNTLWANVNDNHVEIEFDKERDLDYNLNELYSKISEITEIK